MSNISSKKPDAVSRSKVVDLASWNTILDAKAMSRCICMWRKSCPTATCRPAQLTLPTVVPTPTKSSAPRTFALTFSEMFVHSTRLSKNVVPVAAVVAETMATVATEAVVVIEAATETVNATAAMEAVILVGMVVETTLVVMAAAMEVTTLLLLPHPQSVLP